MCLAIPGQIVEVVDEPNRLAKVDVAGVRRTVNIGLLDDDATAAQARRLGADPRRLRASRRSTRRRRRRRCELLEGMGADYEQELEELKASVIE